MNRERRNLWNERIYLAVLTIVSAVLFVLIVGIPGSLLLDTLAGL